VLEQVCDRGIGKWEGREIRGRRVGSKNPKLPGGVPDARSQHPVSTERTRKQVPAGADGRVEQTIEQVCGGDGVGHPGQSGREAERDCAQPARGNPPDPNRRSSVAEPERGRPGRASGGAAGRTGESGGGEEHRSGSGPERGAERIRAEEGILGSGVGGERRRSPCGLLVVQRHGGCGRRQRGPAAAAGVGCGPSGGFGQRECGDRSCGGWGAEIRARARDLDGGSGRRSEEAAGAASGKETPLRDPLQGTASGDPPAATADGASAERPLPVALSSADGWERRRTGEAIRTALGGRANPAAGAGRKAAVGCWVRSRAAAAVDQPGSSAGLLFPLLDRANPPPPLEN